MARIGIVLRVCGALASLGLLAHLAVLLWARHEFTQVESVVALHANMLAETGRLYYDLNAYPFTVSPYGPVFYAAVALLRKLGVPLFQAARCLSFGALLLALWFCWRILGLLVADGRARLAGLILAASSANLLVWGTAGQVDMLALCFSLGAFLQFLEWRERPRPWRLLAAGGLVILAVFTKQTALAGAAAIAACLFLQNRRTGILWTSGVAAVGLVSVLSLDAITGGHYLANAVKANLNPFVMGKLLQQLQYLIFAAGGLILIAAAGAWRLQQPLYVYAALALAVLLATAAKLGSDLNYQMETMLVLCLCTGCALDSTGFFSKLGTNDRSWITLLQLPLLLHITVNTAISGQTLIERIVLEGIRRNEVTALLPYLAGGRVLSTQLDPLVHTRGQLEVEPLIYTLLVNAGATDATQVTRDLAAARFDTVVLYEDVFAPTPPWKTGEVPSLPGPQLEAIRRHYRLVRHIAGPYLAGDYVYEPIRN